MLQYLASCWRLAVMYANECGAIFTRKRYQLSSRMTLGTGYYSMVIRQRMPPLRRFSRQLFTHTVTINKKHCIHLLLQRLLEPDLSVIPPIPPPPKVNSFTQWKRFLAMCTKDSGNFRDSNHRNSLVPAAARVLNSESKKILRQASGENRVTSGYLPASLYSVLHSGRGTKQRINYTVNSRGRRVNTWTLGSSSFGPHRSTIHYYVMSTFLRRSMRLRPEASVELSLPHDPESRNPTRSTSGERYSTETFHASGRHRSASSGSHAKKGVKAGPKPSPGALSDPSSWACLNV